MIHEKIKLSVPGSAEDAALYTYFAEGSPEIAVKKRPVVVVCPGGGYEFTSDREAEPVALRLVAAGFHAVVVRYSVAPARFPTALLEVASAVKYVRDNAARYGCDADKIAVMGFSAGGHLAASYGCFWNKPFVCEALSCDAAALRPWAQLLSYPVITAGEFAHAGSFQNLLGERYAAEKDAHSLENCVTRDTPPAFIWHTQEDDCVPVENALLMANALHRAGVLTELHIFPKGAHGLSLCDETTSGVPEQNMPDVAKWFELAVAFLKNI